METETCPDPELEGLVDEALAELDERLVALLPRTGVRLLERARGWSGKGTRADYFLRVDAFPTLRLAWWLDSARGFRLPQATHRALLRSSIAGYWFIRIIDNVLDENSAADRLLLPFVGTLHEEFTRPYRLLLGEDEWFWARFDELWCGGIDRAVGEASAEDIDEPAYEEIAAGKTIAAHIPLVAVSRLHGRDTVDPAWDEFLTAISSYHQLRNDFLDWRRDLEGNKKTWPVCEARRLCQEGETPATWMLREGIGRFLERLEERLGFLEVLVEGLSSPGAGAWVKARRRSHDRLRVSFEAGLAALGPLIRRISSGPR